MHRPSIALIGSAFLCLLIIVSACQEPKVEVSPKGREDASAPGVVQPPKPGDPTSKDQAQSTPESAQPGPGGECLTPIEAMQSVLKTTEAATFRHLAGRLAANFIERFNRLTGMAVVGDEVTVISSPSYGDNQVAVFAAGNCVLTTLAFEMPTPNHDDDMGKGL